MAYCGIDFGTSNSAIAHHKRSDIALAPVEGKHTTLPSALFFPPAKAPLYGRAAQQHFFEGYEGRFMRSLKRMLGTDLMNWGTMVNDRPRRFDELIGGFVQALKQAGEAHAGHALDSVVMGRPVHFVDGDPGADFAAEDQLKRIATAAGFKHISFQFEPIAAAFSHERKLNGEKLALVADIGGGTSDFTVIRLGPVAARKTERSGDILGNSGIRTGGNDFDKSLSLSRFMPEIGYGSHYGARKLELPRAPFHELSEWSKVNFVYAPKIANDLCALAEKSAEPAKAKRLVAVLERELGHRLLASVEDTKIALTKDSAFDSDLGYIEPGFHVSVARTQFDDSAAPHIRDIKASLAECLLQASVQQNDIDLIVLTGGPTEMPTLKAAILSAFPQAEVSEENKLSSVALGLGYDAQRKFG